MVKAVAEPFGFNFVPPKEGRIPPGVRIQRRRRATVLFVLAIIVIVCLVLKYVQTTSLSTARAKLEAGVKEYQLKGTKKAEKAVGSQKLNENLIKNQDPLVVGVTETSSGDSSSISKAASSAPTEAVKPSSQIKKITKASRPHTQDEFDQLFQRILSKLPSEMHQGVLLNPITNSGTQRIHDLGLRTREFKKLFETWEALHLVTKPDGSVIILDDVVTYLRSRAVKGKVHTEHSADGEPWELGPTIRAYETYRWLLQRLADILFPWVRPYFGDHLGLHAQLYNGGRGIVFTAGTDQAPFVETSISVLRELGCTLPIEVMYLGDGDLDEDARERLEELPDVVTRDIRQMVKDEGWALAGWAGKPFAILLSSFREVIFIDADALFLQNPESLFDDKGYKDTGALFFHDRLMKADGKRHWLETVLPKPISKKARKSRMWGTSDHQQESGVVVVDTFKHFIPMLVVSRMNGPDRDGNSEKGIVGVYDMLFGDKETFWLSWELSGSTSYSFHTGPAGVIGNLPENQRNISHETLSLEFNRESYHYAENISICAPQLLHLSRTGIPLWFNGWILANKFDKAKSPIAQLEMYMKEPDHYMEPESWTIGEANSCCLRSEEANLFTESEKETIAMILRKAREVGAVGKRGGAPRKGRGGLYGVDD